MLNFINLLGESSISWRDDSGNYPAPTSQGNVAVKYYYGSGIVDSVSWASPDVNSGRMTSLRFMIGSDSGGLYLSFTLPSLAYWDMAYITVH
jgi:dextranase